MDWLPALIAAVALPAGAAALGLAWRSRTGRVRTTGGDAATNDLGLAADSLGTAATLVQFSTAYCSRCPSTARQLAAIADDYDGVRHVEIDLRRTGPTSPTASTCCRRPTTLILDADGAVQRPASAACPARTTCATASTTSPGGPAVPS